MTKKHIHSAKIEGSEQAKAIYDQIKKVMEKKVEFDQLQITSNILNGKNESMDGLFVDISSSDLPFFKFAPLSSVVV
jgi:hypothetical protein